MSVVGWRTDGTGQYPSADPVTTWSQTANVIWSTPLDNWGNASPVIVGDRLFVTAEETDLVCLNKADGKILWRRSNPTDEALNPEQIAQRERDRPQLEALQAELQPLTKELNDLRPQIRQQPRDQALRARQKEAQQQVRALEKKIEPFALYDKPNTNKSNGYASATPASDGRRVYAVFGTGVVACYDLNGERQWIRYIEKPAHKAWGHGASPVLVGGKALVHYDHLTALDAETGDTVWQTATPAIWGTPLPTKIEGVDVVVTPKGAIVRVSDGKVVADGMFQTPGELPYGSPILHDGVVYLTHETTATAVRLPSRLADKPEVLWRVNNRKDRFYSSPVLLDGLLYTVSRQQFFRVFDPATGGLLYEKDIEFDKDKRKYTCYPSICRAGKYLFVSCDNGGTVVLEPGREYKEIARNLLPDGFRSTPNFEGRRMYVRGLERVYCIGR
jgi:outer membrane protein assembly factor BamB